MLSAPLAGTYWVPLGSGAALAGPHPVTAAEGMEDRVRALIEDAGVTHFVDLSSSTDWMPDYTGMLPASCAYSRYEILDRRLPENGARLKSMLRSVMDEAAEGRIAYFHCQAGLGRTGTVIGIMLRELGLGGQAALDELIRLRLAAGLHHGSPEFEAQRKFVRDWVV